MWLRVFPLQSTESPSVPVLTSLNGALNVSWQPPTFSSTITSYIIMENETNTKHEVSAVLGSSIVFWVLTGLNNGQAYNVSIQAVACTGLSDAVLVSGVPQVCSPCVSVSVCFSCFSVLACRLPRPSLLHRENLSLRLTGVLVDLIDGCVFVGLFGWLVVCVRLFGCLRAYPRLCCPFSSFSIRSALQVSL